MFLSPVAGSPAESSGNATPVDYYTQTKQIFGCLTVKDSEGLSPMTPSMISPSVRPKKRNKLGTPRTPKSCASTATMDVEDDEVRDEDDLTVSSNENDEGMQGFALRMPGELAARPAEAWLHSSSSSSSSNHHHHHHHHHRVEPPAPNVNPFQEPELNRADSVQVMERSSSMMSEMADGNHGLSPPMIQTKQQHGSSSGFGLNFMEEEEEDEEALVENINDSVKSALFQCASSASSNLSPVASKRPGVSPQKPERQQQSSSSSSALFEKNRWAAPPGGPERRGSKNDSQKHSRRERKDSDDEEEAESSRFRDDFEVVRTVGSGAFGTVYKVRSRLDGCLYAVKTTRARFKGANHRERTLKEVFALAALSNNSSSTAMEGLAHVVRYYQAWIEDERLFIQTELCDASLEARVLARKFPPRLTPADSLFDFLRQMLLALELLHSKELVHLDIKPGNIFVKADTFKLGDFGLVARAPKAVDGPRQHEDIIEGDSRYMSRELLDEADDDFFPEGQSRRDLTKCDIFSLGATAYEIARGRGLPPNGAEWHAIRDGHACLVPGNPVVCPADLVDTITAMMHPDPEQRPSASALLQQPHLQSESQKLASQLLREKQHVETLQQERNVHFQRQRLARSNTWA